MTTKDLEYYIDGKRKTLKDMTEMTGLSSKTLIKWIKYTLPQIKFEGSRKRFYTTQEVMLIAEELFGYDRQTLLMVLNQHKK